MAPFNRRDVLETAATVGLGVTGIGDVAASAQSSGRKRWSFTTDQKITASPTVVGGTAYVGSWDGTVYAVDTETGTEEWHHEFDGPVSAAVNVVDGMVYAGSESGTVTALTATGGEVRWSVGTGGTVATAPTVIDGTVYVSDGSTLRALEAASGSTLWTAETGAATDPAVADGRVYVGGTGGEIAAFDADSGERLWSNSLFGRQLRSLTADGDAVYTVRSSGGFQYESQFFAIEGATGNVRWRTNIDDRFDGLATAPTVHSGTLYAGSGEKSVAVLDASNGGGRRTISMGESVGAPPTVAGGTLFVPLFDGEVRAIDPALGTQQWSFTAEDTVFSSPTVVDGVVYFGSHDGTLYAVDAGVRGHSRDSMVTKGILGHHHTWAGGMTGGASIDATTVEMPDTPVTTGERTSLAVEITGATEARVRLSYTDKSGSMVNRVLGMDPVGDTEAETVRWETSNPLPAVDTVGAWVDITIEADSPTGTRTTRSRYDQGLRAETDSIGYYVFDEVMTAVVLEGRFAGEPVPTETEQAELRQWERAREDDINSYFGSSRGAMGAVGFDLTFASNGGELYELPKTRSKYETGLESSVQTNSAVVMGDLRDTAGNVYQSAYDFWVVTHRGASVNSSKEGVYNRNAGAYTPYLGGPPEEGLYVWLHEFAHAYGLFHLYALGMREGLCLLGSSARADGNTNGEFGEPSLSTAPRMARELGLATGVQYDKSDGFGDMLTPDVIPFSETQDGFRARIPALNSLDYGQEIPIIRNSRVGKRDVVYVLESRTHCGVLAGGRWWYAPGIDDPQPHGAAVVYRRGQQSVRFDYSLKLGEEEISVSTSGYNVVENRNADGATPVLLEPGDVLTDKLGQFAPTEVQFRLEAKTQGTELTPEEFETDVSVTQSGGIGETVTANIQRVDQWTADGVDRIQRDVDGVVDYGEDLVEDPGGTLEETADDGGEWVAEKSDDGGKFVRDTYREGERLWNEYVGHDEDYTVPAVHLIAEDSEGRRVGPTEDGGYENEIPGARASGRRVADVEWISVPADADVEFTLDGSQSEQFVQELIDDGVVAAGSSEAEQLRSQLDLEYDVTRTRYGEDPQLIEEAGETWVADTSVRAQRATVPVGAEQSAEVSNDQGDIELAAVHPDESLDSERVVFENGGDGDLDIGGWRVAAGETATYTVPDGVTVPAGETLTLYTATGSDGGGELYWARSESVWLAEGGRVTVTDDDGGTRLDAAYDGHRAVYYDPEILQRGAGDGFPVRLASMGAVAAGVLYLANKLRANGDEETDTDSQA